MSAKRFGKRVMAVVGVVVLLALVAVGAFAFRTFGGGNIVHARQIAARLQAEAMANPNPIAPGGAPSISAPAPSPSPSPPSGPSASPGPSPTWAPAAAHTATTSSHPTGVKAPTTWAAPGTSPVPAPTSTALAPPRPGVPAAASRRQPTSAEIAQAISAVNSVVPFFTPTADQIASTGNQVCTALDQGQTFSQVKAAALDMIGAGSYSWAIPSSVPDVAIRTVVALYCPTNAAKLV